MKQVDLRGKCIEVTTYQPSHKNRKAITPLLRKQVFERDNYRCRMCLSKKDIEVHELTPQALGGEVSIDNCFTFCYRCHVHMHNAPYFRLMNRQSTKRGLLNALRKGKTLGRPKGSKDSKPRKKDGYYRRYANKRVSPDSLVKK